MVKSTDVKITAKTISEMSERDHDVVGMALDAGEAVKYVNMTPTWSALLPGMIDVIRNGETYESRKLMEGEFERMALAADKWNEYAKKQNEEEDKS